MGVESAILSAESGALIYVRGSQHQVHSIAVAGQAAIVQGRGNNIPKACVIKSSALRAAVKNLGRTVGIAGHIAAIITVSAVDAHISGAIETVKKRIYQIDRGLAVRSVRAVGPVAIPDDIDVGGALHDRAAVVVNAVTLRNGKAHRPGFRQSVF